MRAALRVAHFRKRYRLPADAIDERARLDRVIQSAIDDELLGAALERAGIPTSEEICLRRVESAVRLDRSHADARLAAAWSVALADAIAGRLLEGGPNVVRYRSRVAALVDMMCGAAQGELARAWAWRSLGIWRAGDAIEVATARNEAVGVLAHEARVAPVVLGAVARRRRLSVLVSEVSGQRWLVLARAALVEWATSDAALRDSLLDDGQHERVTTGGFEDAAAVAGAARVDHASAILEDVPAISTAPSAQRSSTARALAALAVLECEPGLVASPHAATIVTLLARTIGRRTFESAGRLAEARPRVGADLPQSVSAPDRAITTKRAATDVQNHDGDIADDQTDGNRPGEDRRRRTTAFGGLVFLLHLVHVLDLPARLVREPALSARSLRWTLHCLAQRLAPVDADDAAALAFAGLPPDSAPPSAHQPPPEDAEEAALRDTGEAIVAALRARTHATVDESDAELLRRVTERHAALIAGPAWIELRLATADVVTDVRRAGLDSDWAGCPGSASS